MDFKEFSKDLSVIRKENLSLDTDENNCATPLKQSLSNILKQDSQKSSSEETLNMCLDLSTYKKAELKEEKQLDKSDDSIKQFK
jgi:hypothetical protein